MPDTELLYKSKGEPVRRLEIFTGSGRRRAWTPEQKAAILAESYESGDKVSAVAGRYGLTPQQLFGWRRRLRDAEAASAGSGGLEFVRAVVDADRPAVASRGDLRLKAEIAAPIEVEIGDVKIRIGRGADAATLAMVLRALKVGA